MKKILPVIFLGCIYRILIGLQGVDGVDAGFCNTFYQIIFSDPDSNIFCFIYYLLGLVGGTWETIFGNFGLIGFRVLEAITLTSAVMVLSKIFVSEVSTKYLAAAAVLSFLFPTIVVTFHYDTFTYFLIALSALFFYLYTVNGNRWYILCAGIIIAFSFFVRIVNVAQILLLTVPLAWRSRQGRIRQGLIDTLSMTVGLLLGIAFIVVFMITLGHFPYYISALDEAFFTLNDSEATHSTGHLLTQYFSGIKNIIAQIITVFVLWKLFKYSYKSNERGRKILQAVLVIAFLVISYTSLPHLSVLALCILLIVTAIYKHGNERMSAVCIYLTAATVVFPIGSDIGFQGIFHWCVGLLVFPSTWAATKLYSFRLERALLIATCCIILCALSRTIITVYGEDALRWECNEQIQANRLNVFVEQRKAKKYKRAIKAINDNVDEKRLLFITNQAAELYYATRTRPFEGHVQPVIYKGNKLFKRLDERAKHYGQFPLIMFMKQEHPSPETPEVQRDTRLWMRRHNYRMVYDDGELQLFKPVTYCFKNNMDT